MTPHVLCQVTILLLRIELITDIHPRQHRILSDIAVVSACDLIQPLQILEI